MLVRILVEEAERYCQAGFAFISFLGAQKQNTRATVGG